MKSKSIILLAVSLGFGLVAAFGISQVVGRSGNSQAQAPVQKKTPVLVAKELIEQGKELTEENVEVAEWPEDLAPENAVTSMEELQQMVSRGRIAKNSPILMDALINKQDLKKVDIKPGHIVIALKVDSEDTFGGLLEPGNHVNITAVFRGRSNDKIQPFARTFLKNIKVISIDADTQISEDLGRSANATVVNLEVTPRQGAMITLVKSTARLKLSLIGRDDVMRDESSDSDVTWSDVFQDKEESYADQQMKKAVAQSNDDSPKSDDKSYQFPFSRDMGKQHKMVIMTNSGPQTYKWRDGEVPMLDGPVNEEVPTNGPPTNPPAGDPESKDSDQNGRESNSGSTSKIPEDEFDE